MYKKLLSVFLFSQFVFSCKTAQEITKSSLSGYWEQQGEGEIVEINDSLVISYYKSNFNCQPNWKISRKFFNTQTATITVNPDGSFTNKEDFTIHTYIKLKEKPTLCKELTANQKNSNAYNFETLWNTFNDQYAFFKERNVDWLSEKRKYQGQFTEETKPFEFYLLLEKWFLN